MTVLPRDERREVAVDEGRHAWIHVARGSVSLDGTALAEGDGVAVAGPAPLTLQGTQEAEVLVFDLA